MPVVDETPMIAAVVGFTRQELQDLTSYPQLMQTLTEKLAEAGRAITGNLQQVMTIGIVLPPRPSEAEVDAVPVDAVPVDAIDSLEAARASDG